ncbi:hypothetical protein [Zavarzinia sp.]|uniref:hypothetical protein n=1 Tax=Zavarzinia sp. TaxID=2027920 RepID=UPI0035626359
MSTIRQRLTILTEGGGDRGLGHITRCTAYAEEWRTRGGIVSWRVDGDTQVAAALAAEDDVSLGAWQEGLPADWTVNGGYVLVDSYHATRGVLLDLAGTAWGAVFLDDTSRLAYPTGIVVHGGPGAIDPQGGAAIWVAGPRFQPLRRAFRAGAERHAVSSRPTRVMVVMGGTDPHHLGPKLAELVLRVFPDATVDLIGAGEVSDPRIRRHQGLSAEAMAALMAAADVCVSGAGQTVFELARMGVPSVLVGAAQNQHDNLVHWPPLTGFRVAGWWNAEGLMESIVRELTVLASPDVRLSIAQQAQQAVDGLGAVRLIDLVEKLWP